MTNEYNYFLSNYNLLRIFNNKSTHGIKNLHKTNVAKF